MFNNLFLETTNTKSKPIYKDVLCENGVPIVIDGHFVIGSGSCALKSFSNRALLINRFEHIIYSFDFGSELEKLIGSNFNKNLVLSFVENYISECLLVNDYIVDIFDVSCTFFKDTLDIKFTINTIYGNEVINVQR